MVHNRDVGREPCPDRIVEDLGGAFGMGCIGGFLWHFVKGARNSPRGDRWHGAMYSARSRAPILGGNFAVWGGTFSCFDCSLQYLRRRDDHWNAIASGFLTGGVLAARGGAMAAGQSALVGGVLLAIIEGVAAAISRTTVQTPREQALMQIEQERRMREMRETRDIGDNKQGLKKFGVWNFIKKLSEGPTIPKSGEESEKGNKNTEISFFSEENKQETSAVSSSSSLY